jgi:hypothetical protein
LKRVWGKVTFQLHSEYFDTSKGLWLHNYTKKVMFLKNCISLQS